MLILTKTNGEKFALRASAILSIEQSQYGTKITTSIVHSPYDNRIANSIIYVKENLLTIYTMINNK